MTSKISFSMFGLGELNTLARQLFAVVSEAYADQPALSQALSALKAAIDMGDRALGNARGEALTEAVQQADSRRDDSFMSLRDHLAAGLRRHGKPEYQLACERLKKVFDQHGTTLHRESYAKQSALLVSLFKDLETAPAVADLATVGATEWLAELERDQAEFEDLYAQRNDDRATADRTTYEEAKQDLRQALEMLLVILNGLHLGGLLPNSEATLGRINQHIERATYKGRGRASESLPPNDDVPPATQSGPSAAA